MRTPDRSTAKRAPTDPCDRLGEHKILASFTHRGKQALEAKDRPLVADKAVRVDCSVALDEAYERVASEKNAPRWDYALVARKRTNGKPVFAIEVHPANAKGVHELIRKKDWAQSVLRGVLDVGEWHWLASGEFQLRNTAAADRLLRDNGILGPSPRLELR